ncbi:hypothetical protein [Henriciella aquimarina]|uniref:hypothetical protein n=1 Tax=Henriciella aquimarina TaxID=545261 RepID=UPI001301C54E|nr:hypothetical protein [Henriciella aquimarina]
MWVDLLQSATFVIFAGSCLLLTLTILRDRNERWENDRRMSQLVSELGRKIKELK